MVSTPERGDEVFDLAADRSQRLCGAQADEQKARTEADRRFLVSIVAASLLLHGLILWALLTIERAPDKADVSREIPVEVMIEPPPPQKSAPPPAKAAERPSEPKPAPTAQQSGKARAEQKPSIASKAEPREEPATEPKPAEPPAKPAAAGKEPRQTPAKDPAKAAAQQSASEEKPAAKAALAGAASSKGGGAQPGAQGSLALPYDLGPPIFRAVAVPLPVEGGDEPMNYKVIVFGLLEREKHYPEAAIARGARGSAVIGFTVDETGQLTSVSLLQSSGETDLDEESVALVRRAAPFPPPPPGAQRSFAAQVNFGVGE